MGGTIASAAHGGAAKGPLRVLAANRDGEATREFHKLANPAVTAVQEAYVKNTVNTLNDQQHLLWEICSEDHAEARDWHCHLIRLIKEYEAGLPLQHPVGMTGYHAWKTELDNTGFFGSPADWMIVVSCSSIPNAWEIGSSCETECSCPQE